MNVKKEYEYWLTNAKADADIVAELEIMDDAKIEDAFYRNLAFGTGGLRGVIGAGTNRMNIYTVAKASQGLADYLKKKFVKPSVAIGYDSRIKSDVFAKVAASVFVANDIKVSIWPTLMPVPMVSFPVVFDGYKYTRNEIFEKLVEVGIGARKYFYPLTNSFECYRNYPTAGAEKTPIAQHIALRVLTLPLYADLSLKDVDRICDVILG